MQRKYYYTLLTYLLVPLAGMSTDIYLPSLPNMVANFVTDSTYVQLTITAFVIAMGVGQLMAGPVSDALGRKKPILLALIFQLIAVLCILAASNIFAVIIARFIQGLAVAFMIVPARAILTDVLNGQELKKHFNYLTIAFALGPIIAPFIGGYTEYYFSWKGSFYFLLCFIVIFLGLIIFTYQETAIKFHQFSFKKTIHHYQMLVSHFDYMSITIFAGILFGYTSIFNVTGPFIFQELLHFSTIEYGYVALAGGAAWFLGNLTNRILFEVAINSKILSVLLCSTVTAVFMLVFAILQVANFWTIAMPSYFLIYFSSIIFPNLVAKCLTQFVEIAATSNACFFALTWTFFSFYSALAANLPFGSTLAIASSFVVINIFALLAYKFVRL